MLVTPSMAQEFLTHNISNRKLDEKTVSLYQRLLKNHLFVLSNDAICFGTNGILLNGQHRLTACVRSNVPMPCIVCRNMPNESYIIMDNGKNRTAADILYVQDVPNAALVSASIRRFLKLKNNYTVMNEMAGSDRTSNAEIEDEFNSKKDFWNNIGKTSSKIAAKGRWKLLKGSDIGGISSYLILEKKHPEDTVMSFFNEIEGLKNPSHSVITLLQQKLNESKRSLLKRLPGFVVQKLVIKAWNAYVTGKTYTHLFYVERSDKNLWFV